MRAAATTQAPLAGSCSPWPFRALAQLIACSAALLASAGTPAAPVVTPQQLTVTVANAAGDSIYDLTLAVNKTATGALISATQSINTDGGKHGSFDALVWAPNSFTGTLDLIVADASKGQILRYSGPNYGTSTAIFTYTTKGSGPPSPVGLAVDAAGDVFAISPGPTLINPPGLWVLPFNKATGAYGAPVLIDQTFGGVATPALAEVLVAPSAATADGSAVPAWHSGDLLVLVGDSLESRVIVYSQAAISAVLAKPKVPLTAPTSTVISSKQFLGLVAVPFGMDLWPADATHGVSLLFTTIDGRIVRFDSSQNAFVANFASGLGLGLEKLKVGSYAGTPYAFVAQVKLPSSGQILQFGAPPASGTNQPLATVSKGVSDPIGLALSSSGSQPASSCVAPNSCSILGPQITQQISGPGAAKIPAGATILEQSCIVPADPRVAIVNGSWSCLGPTINVCGSTPTAGCVPSTLDVANYCPGFPSTVLPAFLCGHSGASGAGFAVVKATAELLDQSANDLYIQTSVNAAAVLPGPYDLSCQLATGQMGPLFAWAPRSDLASIEGTVVEDQSTPYFVDLTGFCDTSGGNSKVGSMFVFGIGLNSAASGLPNGLFGFVTNKFANLTTTIQDASAQIVPTTVTTTLENYVTQSQTYFDNDYQNNVTDYSCALNSIASADVYLRNEAQTSAFSYTPPASGNNNPNPAGDIDARLANLYQTISGDFLFAPNTSWPTGNVPPCVTLSISSGSVATGGSATLSFGPPTPQAGTPLLFAPTSCKLSATDGTYTTATPVGISGTVSTGKFTKSGTYTATLVCSGPTGDTATSVATSSISVAAQTTLTSIAVAPANPSIAKGLTQGFTATGTYSNSTTQNLTGSVTWSSNNTAVATIISTTGVATCVAGSGSATISATSGSISGSTTLTCTAPTLQSIAVTPPNPSVAKGLTQQFSAAGTDTDGSTPTLSGVSWGSTNTGVATINSTTGVATCVAGSGSTTISATSGSISGSTTLTCSGAALQSIAVTPPNPSVAKGLTQQFSATGTDSDGSSPPLSGVSWGSNNTAVATINSTTGIATCVAASGNSTISATSGSISGSTTLSCLPAGLLSLAIQPNTGQSVPEDGTQQFTVQGSYTDGTTPDLTSVASWNSTMTGVATVGNGATGGFVTAVGPGTTAISAAYGGLTSASVNVTVGAPSLSLTAMPSSVVVGQNVSLQWTSAGLAPDDGCTITSNSSDNPLNFSGEPISGTLVTTESVSQYVTYTISCGYPTATSAQATVLYTLQTIYQYTGNPFASGFQQYTTSDRVIASMTMNVPLPVNQTGYITATTVPGLLVIMSDGVQTLSSQTNGVSLYDEIGTDANGNIVNWSVSDYSDSPEFGIDTQQGLGEGSLDLGYQGGGDLCYDASADCGANNSPGTWTSTNLESLRVIYGTEAYGESYGPGQLYELIVGGTPSAPTLGPTASQTTLPIILSQAPEPSTCSSSTGVVSSAVSPGISALAFLPNASSGFPDLVAANSSEGDVFVLSGPSYQPSFDVNNASGNCWDTGPNPNAVAADAAGDVVGVGHDINSFTTPSLYFFPPTQAGAVQSKPNFVLMDNVNNDPSLTSCTPSDPSGAGCLGSLVDAVVPSSANSVNGVAAGDLLVLVGDPGSSTTGAKPVVLRFPAAAIQTAKAYASNCPNSFGSTTGSPQPCVTNSSGSQLVTQTSLGLALNDSPVSMDISPIDGSLFIATNQGNIYQLTATSTGYGSPQLYAQNETGIQKIRLGQLNGTLYLLATIVIGDPTSSVDMYVGSPSSGSFNSPAVSAPVSNAYAVGLAVQSPSVQAPSPPPHP